jgi:PAS domain S-box-containing protein
MSDIATGRDGVPSIRSSAENASLDVAMTQLLDILSDGICVMDENFRITYANKVARKISRIRDEDLNGKTHWELYPGTVGTQVERVYREVMKTRKAQELDAFYYETFDTWYQIQCLPASNGIALHYRDITERRRIQDEQRESEDRLRLALTATNGIGVWHWDVAKDLVYSDERFANVYGVDPAAAANGVPIAEFMRNIAPEDILTVGPAIEAAVRDGSEFSSQYRISQPDGSVVWVAARGRCTHDAAGTPQRFTGVIIDITDQKQDEQALREQYVEIDRQRRELETIYRLSPVSMGLFEPKELRLLRLNERLAEMHGKPVSELIGKTLNEIAPSLSPVHELLRRAAAGEPMLNQNVEGSLPNSPNETRHWNVNYSPIFNKDGSVQSVASASIETTQQKRAELALIQSEKLAAVGRMASSIAHEINNPLESVTNLLYIARSHVAVPEVQHFLDLADQELRRVSIIANQTLRFHKQASFPREATPEELFATVLSIYEGRLRNSGIKVEKRKLSPRSIRCFEGDIRQVLNNLVGNAVDAMSGGGRLHIRGRVGCDWATGRTGIILTVADTGVGMSAETAAKVFEPFFTTKGINGTGLGLWISSEIVERHEGKLLLRSRPSPGTVFCLFLPFQVAKSRKIPLPESVATKGLPN